ncbi:toxic anion resistance protein TelA [Lachnoanaerobaculum sp. MSX33]|jgi:putative tellurite resistance protein|uniref:toxic anion resistance protein n=1 Tax=Lachnoanaerobaculum TaxID=1164882 RepID=UPI00027A484F|nr:MULTISPECIES: toxic anion resistance protein [unclassified Lachnoanaerobaculum]EJP24071.1 toxic anion resistance protein TelA [Lachnoanaerobaculum sp. ICM7]ETO99210.1 toxic anion resistance protein TelA [Lachnoanaerobaculum sp. MSX33]MBF1010840.1 toxic anion resistance protein [Lachnoanaerobaculum sp.]GMO03221.1 toxic anion resistance protein [Lachnoanaerobaculum sp. JCM 36186]
MGLDFSKAKTVEAEAVTSDVAENEALPTVQTFDIAVESAKIKNELADSAEVDALVSKIELDNLDSIVTFGGEVATEISKSSDLVLNSMNIAQIEETSKMLGVLTNIMSKFDIEEIKQEPGLFDKLFGGIKKQLDKIMTKYQTMGGEIDKVYVELKGYEGEIKETNKKLNTMFESNVNYYHDLLKYIMAGEQGCKELEGAIAERTAEMERTGDKSMQFELTTLNNALMMLEQRTQDLRVAENVAMQTIPMLKTMEFSNINLIRKINSAFIITLPIFKQSLAQAIMLKRQRLQAEALSELDKKTNEMILKNATNTVEQAKLTAQMASGSSIKVDTLEKSWRTIVNGIEETKRIQDDARRQRVEDKAKLENIKNEFYKKFGV